MVSGAGARPSGAVEQERPPRQGTSAHSAPATPLVPRAVWRRGIYEGMSWLAYAILSALAAAATAILAKMGLEGVPSTLATALRTAVVLVFSWAIVFGLGQQSAVASLSRRSVLFLTLSGLATGVSWLAYFHALKVAPASWVAPIDKLSLPLTVLLAAVVLQESVSWPSIAGVALMVIGALLTLA